MEHFGLLATPCRCVVSSFSINENFSSLNLALAIVDKASLYASLSHECLHVHCDNTVHQHFALCRVRDSLTAHKQ